MENCKIRNNVYIVYIVYERIVYTLLIFNCIIDLITENFVKYIYTYIFI